MKKALRLLVFLCVILTKCATNNDFNVQPDNGFPNSTGTEYVYRVTDSLSNTTSDVVVSIVGHSKLANGQLVTLWTYKYDGKTDTSYVFGNKDSIAFYETRTIDLTQRVVLNLIQFPLVVGAKWRTSFIGDTSTVISNNTVSVSRTTFANTFLIHDFGRSNNYAASVNQWFTPNVGLVKMDYISHAGTRKWVLMKYTIR